jgi:hypothetical protein
MGRHPRGVARWLRLSLACLLLGASGGWARAMPDAKVVIEARVAQPEPGARATSQTVELASSALRTAPSRCWQRGPSARAFESFAGSSTHRASKLFVLHRALLR